MKKRKKIKNKIKKRIKNKINNFPRSEGTTADTTPDPISKCTKLEDEKDNVSTAIQETFAFLNENNKTLKNKSIH